MGPANPRRPRHTRRRCQEEPAHQPVEMAHGDALVRELDFPDREPRLHGFGAGRRAETITCPAGEVEPFEPGETVHFDPEVCGACPLRANCTQAASGKGHRISIARDEAQQNKFRKLQQTSSGRATFRQRVAVEHSLAHIAARKGDNARYIGVRKNLFDLRRSSAIQNLEEAQRMYRRAA